MLLVSAADELDDGFSRYITISFRTVARGWK